MSGDLAAGLERLRRLDLPGDEAPGVTLASMAADEIERLQGLIDDLERAEMMPGRRDTNPAWWAAIDALLAAATEEADRG